MERKGITDKNTLERVTKYFIGKRTSIKNICDKIEGLEKNNSYNTISSYKDMGDILENVVYLELLRRGYEVYIGFEGIKKINLLDWLIK